MDFSAIKDLYIGSTPVQSAWLNGSKVWGRKPAVDEQSIRDAMILWYDIAKQGATNENMAENPVLRDLSGNGHDATLYNFAWSGMSGMGGYKTDFSNDVFIHLGGRISGSKTYKTVTINRVIIDGGTVFLETTTEDANIPSFTVKVTGLEANGARIYGSYVSGIDWQTDGIYEFPSLTGINKGLAISAPTSETLQVPIVIEQLPLYPNALVSDGVDDYCLAEGLPLLNKENGYTVIAKRKWLQDIKRNALVSRNVIWQTEELGGIDGAFNIECYTEMCYSFGQGTSLAFNNLDGFTYQTSKSYNGKDLAIGDKEDNNHLCIAAINKGTNWFSSIAIYSLLLFDRDLTSEEIEWVKTNLIETEQ